MQHGLSTTLHCFVLSLWVSRILGLYRRQTITKPRNICVILVRIRDTNIILYLDNIQFYIGTDINSPTLLLRSMIYIVCNFGLIFLFIGYNVWVGRGVVVAPRSLRQGFSLPRTQYLLRFLLRPHAFGLPLFRGAKSTRSPDSGTNTYSKGRQVSRTRAEHATPTGYPVTDAYW